jgi:hypothetical protein
MPDPSATAGDFLYTLILAFLVFLFGKIRNAIKRGSAKPIVRNGHLGLIPEQTDAKSETPIKEVTKSVQLVEKVNVLDNESPKAVQTAANHIPVPEIVTRTGKNLTGKPLFDRFFGIEREFTKVEDSLLLKNYRKGLGIVAIANLMQIDQKQIAIRLIRMLINPKGPMEDKESASEDGHYYRHDEKEQIETEFLAGTPIEKIATMHNRTVLAIGWQLLERPSKPLLK